MQVFIQRMLFYHVLIPFQALTDVFFQRIAKRQSIERVTIKNSTLSWLFIPFFNFILHKSHLVFNVAQSIKRILQIMVNFQKLLIRDDWSIQTIFKIIVVTFTQSCFWIVRVILALMKKFSWKFILSLIILVTVNRCLASHF